MPHRIIPDTHQAARPRTDAHATNKQAHESRRRQTDTPPPREAVADAAGRSGVQLARVTLFTDWAAI